MKFAIATNDAYQCVLEALLTAGWQLEKLFVSPENWMYSNHHVIERALELHVPVQYSPVTQQDLAELKEAGCEILVVSCYQWKIPKWDEYLAHAINFHPSPLPEARGPYPLVRAILENRKHWAVTCHLINEGYDCGDIIDALHFPLDEQETHDSLRLKVQMVSARLATRIAGNFDELWRGARAQGAGSYWQRWRDQDRVIDFTQSVDLIMRRIRAFGDIECTAMVNGTKIYIHRAQGWIEPLYVESGSVVHASDLALVVAAQDGYIAITEWSVNEPGCIFSNTRR